MEDDPGGPTLLRWVLYKSVSRPTLHSVDPHFRMGPIQVSQWTVMGPIHMSFIEDARVFQKNLKTPFCP